MQNARSRHDSMPPTTCDLGEVPGFRDLPGALLQELQTICRKRSYALGQTVSEMGAQSDVIGVVSDGILRMQKSLPDGRQHVVGLLVGGDIYGRVFDGGSHFSVEAASDAEVCAFDRPKFEALLLRSPELDRLLLLNMMSELDRAHDWMIILANPRIRGRLAGFLLLLCTRFLTVDHLITLAGRSIRVHIPLSRPDVAHLLGTRVESVSRALHSLADDGMIEILRPDLVDIRNIEALSEETGEPEMPDTGALARLIRHTAKRPD